MKKKKSISWSQIVDELEVHIRNHLVLSKTVLGELERIQEKTKGALEEIEEILNQDLPELRSKLREALKQESKML